MLLFYCNYPLVSQYLDDASGRRRPLDNLELPSTLKCMVMIYLKTSEEPISDPMRKLLCIRLLSLSNWAIRLWVVNKEKTVWEGSFLLFIIEDRFEVQFPLPVRNEGINYTSSQGIEAFIWSILGRFNPAPLKSFGNLNHSGSFVGNVANFTHQ